MKANPLRSRRLKTALCLGALALLAATGVAPRAICAEKNPPATPATPAAAAKPVTRELATRSTFQAPPADAPGARNPFVPIGYVRPAAAAAVAAKETVLEVKAEQFVVTSYSLDPPPLAVINGRTYSVGEKVPVGDKPGAAMDFVTVRQIRDGEVTLDYRGRLLVCKSQRKGGGAPGK